ncbi:Ger(x)C family spore germination protein [Caldibacillus lycopersici]|uniref:Ger(X)C family spore germination protein n=1 Tax=Perspicuibacillus lycopersici TaxID=1325689 RepID=A0AAE3IPQ3_9BACI|nr:Ger(x)C family spore germination protein [Perspicuibacillus lycopersici]MCU9612308.1 Ger(x)C family spore germination protein [Perspicuibacillus lycopersici]
MKRAWISIVLLTLLTGCWDQSELTDLAFVSAVGIDFGENEKYRLTFQIINPKNVAGTQQQGGIQGPPVTLYEGGGDNILEGALETTQRVSRQLFFDHATLVVIGEDVARKGIFDILELFDRSPDFRTTARVVIAKDAKAEELLSILTPIDQVPAQKIVKMIDFTPEIWGENIKVNVSDIIRSLYFPGREPLISGVSIIGDKEKGKSDSNIQSSKPSAVISASSLGIFKKDRLIGWTNGETTKGINWVNNNIKGTTVNVDWGDVKEAIGITLIRTKSRLSAEIKNGIPSLKVHIDTEGNVSEVHVPIPLNSPGPLKKIDQLLNAEISKEVHQAIEYAQKKKTDILGFGEQVRYKDPKYWETIKNKWDDEIFPNVDVEVTVEAFVRRTDLKMNPYFYDLKKEKEAE